jgi:DNA-3-methyladenine glycosylase
VRRAELAVGPVAAARRLLGATLVAGEVAVRLVEVEAYDGASDPASHAYRGERPRTATMFGEPGHLYVYLSYGVHNCMNVVCRPAGTASAVLLRGGVVLRGHELVARRRGRTVSDGRLDGPGILCQALGIDRSSDGVDLFDPRGDVRLRDGVARRVGERVVTGPRVGITKAVERPWRLRLVAAVPRTPRIRA